MKRKLIWVTLLFSGLLIALTLGIVVNLRKVNPIEQRQEQMVALNEITNLVWQNERDTALEKLSLFQTSLEQQDMTKNNMNTLFILSGICLIFLLVVFCYIYWCILRPFDKMKQYAEQIAQGNFDLPLRYERSNYFGEFTWAFDHMRLEVTKARSCEREAILNNKTVIATLSHDIKTPISSIRAYAEGLEANLDRTPEKRAMYLNVIIRKCDEVSKLTNDLFLHSLSDLDKLKMNLEPIEIRHFIAENIAEIAAERGDVQFIQPDFTAMVCVDRLRLIQLLENLINNSRKYAKSRIDLYLSQSDDHICLHVRDYGEGIPDEDMPFILDKFYRGKNCGTEQGSGLGLYIVNYIAGQMNGQLLLNNHSDGLEVILSLPKISN